MHTTTSIPAPRSHARPLAMLTKHHAPLHDPMPASTAVLSDAEACRYCGGRRPAEGLPAPEHIIRDLRATHRKQCDCIAAHGRRDLALDDQIRELVSELDTALLLAGEDVA